MDRKPIVYISSPYTKGDPAINTNFQVRTFHELLDEKVVCPLVPLFSHFLHLVQPRPYEDWMQYDLELLHGVDACVRLNAKDVRLNYFVSESSGADREVARCLELGKPVFFSIKELYDWVRDVWTPAAAATH